MMILVLANLKSSTGLSFYDIFTKATDFDQSIVQFLLGTRENTDDNVR
jgi:hypothetical protein